MPANRGANPDWHPHADFAARHDVVAGPPLSSRVATSHELAAILCVSGIAELDVYDGDNDTKQSIALEAAEEWHDPTRNVLDIVRDCAANNLRPPTMLVVSMTQPYESETAVAVAAPEFSPRSA